jgi:hypothetical protein
MRRLIALTFALAVTAGAGKINVISSFDPKFNPGGPWTWCATSIDYDGRCLWTTVVGYLLKRNYPRGSIIATYGVPIWPVGSAYDGTYLYIIDVSTSPHIYKFDPVRGVIIGSFPYPAGMRAYGLAYGNGFLYFAEYLAGDLYKLNTSGSIVASFHLGFGTPRGLAYVENAGTPYLFCSTRPHGSNSKSVVYRITTTGSVLDSAGWPDVGLIPGCGASGLGYDGEYLWGIHNIGSGAGVENLALQLQYINDFSVEPASVGKIKALFR